jgi:hypothetical protein
MSTITSLAHLLNHRHLIKTQYAYEYEILYVFSFIMCFVNADEHTFELNMTLQNVI